MMNLFEFFENWYPNTSIVIETNKGEIFNGLAKDIPSELQRKYWIKAGQVRNSEGKMIIPVEHEEEINQRLEERNSISFDDVLQNILNDIEINASIKKAFDVVVRSANDYCYYRNWDSFPIEALGQRTFYESRHIYCRYQFTVCFGRRGNRKAISPMEGGTRG